MPYAALPHGKVHYALDGDPGAPALVLCHALGTALTLWEPQVASLAARFRVVRYDLPGHGAGSAPDDPYTLARLGEDVIALMDALAIERAHLCGLSIGGILALQIALAAPDRVARLAVANTAARIGTREGWEERIALVRTAGMAPVADGSIQRWFTPDFQARAPGLMARFREGVAATVPHAYIGCCAALRDADLRASLADIDHETLVIAGRHDPVTTPAHAAEIAAGVRRGRVVELDAAHLSNVEASDAFTRALLAFLS